MTTHTQNFGKLTPDQEHELDIRLDRIAELTYQQDPQPCYQLSTNDKGETIATYENGFENYLSIINEIQ